MADSSAHEEVIRRHEARLGDRELAEVVHRLYLASCGLEPPPPGIGSFSHLEWGSLDSLLQVQKAAARAIERTDRDDDPQRFQEVSWLAVMACAAFIQTRGVEATALLGLGEALQNRRTGAFDPRLDRPEGTNVGLTPNQAVIYAYIWAASEAYSSRLAYAAAKADKEEAAAGVHAVWKLAGKVLNMTPRAAKNKVRAAMTRSDGMNRTAEAALLSARRTLRAGLSPLVFLQRELPEPSPADKRAASRRRHSSMR